jgi:hypothetical protein
LKAQQARAKALAEQQMQLEAQSQVSQPEVKRKSYDTKVVQYPAPSPKVPEELITIKPAIPHELSKELQLYIEKVEEAILGMNNLTYNILEKSVREKKLASALAPPSTPTHPSKPSGPPSTPTPATPALPKTPTTPTSTLTPNTPTTPTTSAIPGTTSNPATPTPSASLATPATPSTPGTPAPSALLAAPASTASAAASPKVEGQDKQKPREWKDMFFMLNSKTNNNIRYFTTALQSLSQDPGLYKLLPYLIDFVCKNVPKHINNLGLLKSLMQVVILFIVTFSFLPLHLPSVS